MQLKELASNPKTVVGIKQTTKILNQNRALLVFVAQDADASLTHSICKLASEKNVEIIWVESMQMLGKACNIDVGAATAVIEK